MGEIKLSVQVKPVQVCKKQGSVSPIAVTATGNPLPTLRIMNISNRGEIIFRFHKQALHVFCFET